MTLVLLTTKETVANVGELLNVLEGRFPSSNVRDSSFQISLDWENPPRTVVMQFLPFSIPGRKEIEEYAFATLRSDKSKVNRKDLALCVDKLLESGGTFILTTDQSNEKKMELTVTIE